MTILRTKKAVSTEKKASTSVSKEITLKRTAKKSSNVPKIEEESEAPSSDNRLQSNLNLPLSSRKQTRVAEKSIAKVTDFSNLFETNDASHASVKNDAFHASVENDASHASIKNDASHASVENSTTQTPVKNDSTHVLLTNETDHISVEKTPQIKQKDNEENKKRKRILSSTGEMEEKDQKSDDEDELATSSSKRCCKSDLKKCLRAGDIIENNRVPEHILKANNDGKKLLAMFDGQNFIDLQTEKSYRSVTNWVKDRMLSLGKISTTSNISGWDYAIVHRDNRTTTLRLLVEETKQKADQMRAAMKEQREGTFTSPLVSTMFSESTSPLLGSSSSAILKTTSLQSKTSQPTFGVSGFAGFLKTQPTEEALHQRLVELRDQVSEVERMLYVSKTFMK